MGGVSLQASTGLVTQNNDTPRSGMEVQSNNFNNVDAAGAAAIYSSIP